MENIHFFIEDVNNDTVNCNTTNDELQLELDHYNNDYETLSKNILVSSLDEKSPHFVNYSNNTIKELLLICHYYGITKDFKLNKCTKTQIIHILTDFEILSTNEDIVFKRKNMWFYINELKNDKFMKKYILC